MKIWIEDGQRRMTQEQKDFKELIQISCMNDTDLYNGAAIRFARKYIPKKAIEYFLPPTVAFEKEDYERQVHNLIHVYHVVKSLRFQIKFMRDRGEEPDPEDLAQLRRGEEMGF